MGNRIKDDSGDRHYWVQTPMLVWALVRDPYELALWFTIKTIAGEERECTLSTEDLAALSMMSVGKASQCRARLIEIGLLEGEVRKDPDYPQPVWHLTIPDVWETNAAWAKNNKQIRAKINHKDLQRTEINTRKKSLHQVKKTTKEPSPHEGGTSPHEGGTSPHEGGTSPHEANKIIYRSDQDQIEIGGDRARLESNAVPAQPPAPPPATLPVAESPSPKPPLLANNSFDMPVTANTPSPSSGPPPPHEPTAAQLQRWAPRVDPRKFRSGYIPAGTGATPVEVWYESFAVTDAQTRLTAPDQDDLRVCTDLDRLRMIVATYRRCDFKRKRNIQLVLDWYRDGVPERYIGAPSSGGANSANFGLAAYAAKERVQHERDFGPDLPDPEKEQRVREYFERRAKAAH